MAALMWAACSLLGQWTVIAQTSPGLICRSGSTVCLKMLPRAYSGITRVGEQGVCQDGLFGEMYINQDGECREVCRDGLTDYELGLDKNCDRITYKLCVDGSYLPSDEPCDDVLCSDFDDCYQWASDHCPAGEDIEPSSFVFNSSDSFSFTCSSPERPWKNPEQQ